MEINGSYFSDRDLAELANLYHLARTAGKEDRHSRLCWAAEQFSKANGGVDGGYPVIRCYKAITRALA